MSDHKMGVLFVCVHNSARSQMAEAFLKARAGDRLRVESAGLEPGTLNPLVVEVMGEVGIDISQNATKSVFGLFKAGRLFTYVITVCDQTAAERCPIFPGFVQRLHWSFEDPSRLQGNREEQLAGTRIIRDAIRQAVNDFADQLEVTRPEES